MRGRFGIGVSESKRRKAMMPGEEALNEGRLTRNRAESNKFLGLAR